jgi:Arc/MetJ family transcription regulator
MLGDESAGLGATVARQRGELAAALAAAVAEPSTPTSRRRSAVQGLVRLGEGGRAYDLLLRHHSATLAAALRWLRAPRRDDVQGMRVYTAEVSHAVCDAVRSLPFCLSHVC